MKKLCSDFLGDVLTKKKSCVTSLVLCKKKSKNTWNESEACWCFCQLSRWNSRGGFSETVYMYLGNLMSEKHSIVSTSIPSLWHSVTGFLNKKTHTSCQNKVVNSRWSLPCSLMVFSEEVNTVWQKPVCYCRIQLEISQAFTLYELLLQSLYCSCTERLAPSRMELSVHVVFMLDI